ncbi:hypothetical protein NLI96_g8685 [Meripilus lineatus]|uniref:Uncharacterized protein n=1 Tax=Meripilus lineatus TaxID=2056292 RepID=A0AAD5UWZ2_9APHY|nr:hypothetical protein NLI96_g8685 [Physisporinus lineatus]
MCPNPSVAVPMSNLMRRPRPAFELDSDSELEYDSESDHGRDPLEILCDILDILEESDCSLDARTPSSDVSTCRLRTSLTGTAPLRLSKA